MGTSSATHLAQQALWTRYQNLIASSSSTVDTTPGNTLLLSVDALEVSGSSHPPHEQIQAPKSKNLASVFGRLYG